MTPKRFVLILFFAIGLLTYGNSFHGVFVYDDVHTIQSNPFVHSLRWFFHFFSDGRTISFLPENSTYRPMSTVIYALCWAIGQGSTWPFHAVKILEHVLVAWLVFLISLQLFKGLQPIAGVQETFGFYWKKKGIPVPASTAAFFGALFLLVHPGLSESVNYISATSSLQCALFYLAAFFFYLKFSESKKFQWKSFLWMGVFFFLSMLTKEEGVTFPLVVLAHSLLFNTKKSSELFLVLFGLSAFFLGLYFSLRPETATIGYGQIPRFQYALTQLRAWVFYFLWIFRPWGYAIEHLEFGFSTSFFEWRVLASFAVVLGAFLGSFLVLFRVRSSKEMVLASFGFLWFACALLPASSLMPLSEPINEHRYYLAYTLFFPVVLFFLLKLLVRVPFRKPVKASSFAVVFVISVLAARTHAENKIWQSAEKIWSTVLKSDPANGRAYNNLGYAYLEKGMNAQALECFQNCAKTWPGYKYCYLNQHITYLNLNQIPQAKQAIEKAYELDPNSVFAMYYIGNFRFQHEQNPTLALDILNHCDQYSEGKYVPCVVLKAEVQSHLNDWAQALQTVERGLGMEPTNGRLQRLKLTLLKNLGRTP